MDRGEHRHPARYVTLDEPGVLAAAHRNPAGFLRSLEGPVVLDEIQLAPEMFRNIKLEVDRDRRPGRFLLTGSANVLMLPRLSDSLAGRMEILTLWPFSQGEIEGVCETFIDAVFAESLGNVVVPALDRAPLLDRILVGEYPEVIGRSSESAVRLLHQHDDPAGCPGHRRYRGPDATAAFARTACHPGHVAAQHVRTVSQHGDSAHHTQALPVSA